MWLAFCYWPRKGLPKRSVRFSNNEKYSVLGNEQLISVITANRAVDRMRIKIVPLTGRRLSYSRMVVVWYNVARWGGVLYDVHLNRLQENE